jgi:hypothetical protein
LTQTAIFIGADSIGASGQAPVELPTAASASATLPILDAMQNRSMPTSAIVAFCALLIGGGVVMASQAIALAADGAFQLVRIVDSGDVYGLDARILGAAAHQGLVVLAVRAGATDTHLLSLLLGVGQLVLPALVWSLAIARCRSDRLVCATVAMVAGLSAGTTWFVNVGEIVLAVPLTIVVAVCLWQPRAWRARDAVLAIAAATVLVASYETAAITGSLLAVWAAWRALGARGGADTIGSWAVAALSALSVAVALWGTRSGSNPTHSQSLLYYVVSLEPWPFYLGLAGIAAVVAGLGPWLGVTARRVVLVAGVAMLVVCVVGLEPDPVTAFEARGGAAVAAFGLELFLLWRWIAGRRPLPSSRVGVPRGDRLLVVASVAFVAAMAVVNVQPVLAWSRSLEAFRVEVDRTRDVAIATDSLSANRREVLWGWTASSLSLLVRTSPTSGILVDRNPSLVPFPPAEAREQLDDRYTWRR